jgi:hypothetical protein
MVETRTRGFYKILFYLNLNTCLESDTTLLVGYGPGNVGVEGGMDGGGNYDKSGCIGKITE